MQSSLFTENYSNRKPRLLQQRQNDKASVSGLKFLRSHPLSVVCERNHQSDWPKDFRIRKPTNPAAILTGATC